MFISREEIAGLDDIKRVNKSLEVWQISNIQIFENKIRYQNCILEEIKSKSKSGMPDTICSRIFSMPFCYQGVQIDSYRTSGSSRMKWSEGETYTN